MSTVDRKKCAVAGCPDQAGSPLRAPAAPPELRERYLIYCQSHREVAEVVDAVIVGATPASEAPTVDTEPLPDAAAATVSEAAAMRGLRRLIGQPSVGDVREATAWVEAIEPALMALPEAVIFEMNSRIVRAILAGIEAERDRIYKRMAEALENLVSTTDGRETFV